MRTIDMHCDTLSELLVIEPGETVEESNHLCVDVERDAARPSMLAVFCLLCKKYRMESGMQDIKK